MRKAFHFFLWAFLFSICSDTISGQESFPSIKNIFKIIKTDPSHSLWTLKKTDLLRINAVKMKGEAQLHKHPDADHTILLIKGVIIAEINGEKLKLKKGDILSIPAGVPHKYSVRGRKAILVSMDAPYYDPEKTILLK
ncbi:MAG: cupin domain-containing protein [Bacteroidetes bacterium]|nr:cupin domain-containing protein [Bacteroidota bacterium]MBS1633378.1 cupin domain-containing protein [Bacteroidota bacterium]